MVRGDRNRQAIWVSTQTGERTCAAKLSVHHHAHTEVVPVGRGGRGHRRSSPATTAGRALHNTPRHRGHDPVRRTRARMTPRRRFDGWAMPSKISLACGAGMRISSVATRESTDVGADAVATDREVLEILSEAPSAAHLPPAALAPVHYLPLDGFDHPLADVYSGTTDDMATRACGCRWVRGVPIR